MTERQGSGIRAGRFFTLETLLCGDGNAASAPGGLPVRTVLFAATRAGRRAEMHEGWMPPSTPWTGMPPGSGPAPGEAP